MASIALVHPLFLALDANEQSAESPYFPLGLLYLAAYIRDNGHQVAIYDGTFEPSPATLNDFLAEGNYDAVGISAVVTNRATAFEVAEIAAAADLTVIVGGPDPTADPATYLANPAVDLVVHHEGEQTIVELLDMVAADELVTDALSSVFGIAWRQDGELHVNPPRTPIDDIDTLPVPARDLIDMDRYLDQWQNDKGYTSITVATGRGCPWGCEWCADAVHGPEWRQRSPESVAAEVKALKAQFNVDSIRIVDDVDGFDPDWVEQWAKTATATNAAVPFEALITLTRTDLPMLEVRDSL